MSSYSLFKRATTSAVTVLALAISHDAAAQAQISGRFSYPEKADATTRSLTPYETPVYEELLRSKSVFQREREQFDPVSIRKGAFFVRPALEFTAEHTDNVFYSENNEESDMIFSALPSLNVESDFERHELNFRAAGRFASYADNEMQDYSDVSIGTGGRYDLAPEFFISGDTSYQRLHENRSSPNNEAGNLDNPTEFELGTVSASINHNPGLINTRVGIDFLHWDFDDTLLLDNDDRDRHEVIPNARIGYDLSEDAEVYVQGSYNTRDYNSAFDTNGQQRNSEGWQAATGIDFQLTNLIRMGAYVGYADQDYEDTTFDNIDAVIYGLDALWNVTPLTSLIMEIDRNIRDSITQGSSGFVESRYLTKIEHELLRNLLVEVLGEYRNYDFEGPATNRDDHLYAFGGGLEYFVGRDAIVALNYTRRIRDTNVASQDFDQNSILGSVTFRF